MQTHLRDYVIETFKSYKRLIALKKELIYDFDGYLSAARIDGMPKGTGISDPIGNAIRRKREEIKGVRKEIQRIESWLEYLNDRERFFIYEFYINNRYRPHISNSWATKHNQYLSRITWHKTQKNALKKIINLIKEKDDRVNK